MPNNQLKYLPNLNWLPLDSEEKLSEIIDLSCNSKKGVAIFKHSTSCSISSLAKKRLQLTWNFDEEDLPLYSLDILNYRNLSNKIAEEFDVVHQSPQLIVIKDKKVIYHASHLSINLRQLKV